MLIGLNVISGSCISKLIGRKFTSFLSLTFYTFVFTVVEKVTFTLLTCVKKHSAAKPDENVLIEGEGSIKAAEKDPSTTIVGSINATEFWQRRTRPPSFLLLLSCKMDLAIPQ